MSNQKATSGPKAATTGPTGAESSPAPAGLTPAAPLGFPTGSSSYDPSGSSSGSSSGSGSASAGPPAEVPLAATTGDLEWAGAGSENQGKVRDKGGEWREPTPDELLTLQGVDPKLGIAGGKVAGGAVQLIPGAHPAPAAPLNVEWGQRGSENEGKVRDPGKDWREPTPEEKAQQPMDTRPNPLDVEAQRRDAQRRKLVRQDPGRSFVELIKENNAELLRITGHTASTELRSIEKAFERLNEPDEARYSGLRTHLSGDDYSSGSESSSSGSGSGSV